MSEFAASNPKDRMGVNELHDAIDEKIRLLVAEQLASGWPTEEVLLAINDVIKIRWMDRLDDRDSREPTMSEDFISDGNEG